MDTKIETTSLIDEIDVNPVTASEKAAEGLQNGKKPVRRNRKVKPYEALNQVGAHQRAKKAEKEAKKSGKVIKSTRKPSKPVRGSKPGVIKPAVKKPSGGSKKPVGQKGDGISTCRVCGKPLTRVSSVSSGVGPECERQVARLPKGVTLEQHYEALIVVEEPKGFIKLREAIEIARKKGVTAYSFMIAIGGNRMLRPPLSPAFKTVMYKNARWVNKASVSEKELSKLKK